MLKIKAQYFPSQSKYIDATEFDKQELIRRRREILKSSGVRLPSITRQASRQASGKTQELSYFITISKLIESYFRDMTERLIPKIPGIVEAFKSQTRVDAEKFDQTYGETVTRAIRDVSIGIALDIPETLLQARTGNVAVQLSNFNRNQFDKQVRTVLGVNPILNEPYLQSQVESFVQRNASLIKDIPEASLRRVETKLRTGIERGLSSKKLTEGVQKELKIAKNRAKLIARDQTNKFMGKLNELRQTELGITEYVWSTSRDERVRHSHATKEGKVFKWSKPPADTGNPGDDINCRCVGIPVLDKFKSGRNIKTTTATGATLIGTAIAANTIRQALAAKEL